MCPSVPSPTDRTLLECGLPPQFFPCPPHPAVASGDVLQRAGGRLRRVPVELTALEQAVVQAHDLGAPQPLQALGVLGDLGEGERVGREGQLGGRVQRVSRARLAPAPARPGLRPPLEAADSAA